MANFFGTLRIAFSDHLYLSSHLVEQQTCILYRPSAAVYSSLLAPTIRHLCDDIQRGTYLARFPLLPQRCPEYRN